MDKLSRVLQQQRSELQATIKNLRNPSTTDNAVSITPSETPINGHNASKVEPLEMITTDTNESTSTQESPNLYGLLFSTFFSSIFISFFLRIF